MFEALNTLRNDFAHGRIRELTAERGRELADAMMPLVDEVATTEEAKELTATVAERPRISVVYALIACRAVLMVSVKQARARREEEREAVEFRRAMRSGGLLGALLSQQAEQDPGDEPAT